MVEEKGLRGDIVAMVVRKWTSDVVRLCEPSLTLPLLARLSLLWQIGTGCLAPN